MIKLILFLTECLKYFHIIENKKIAMHIEYKYLVIDNSYLHPTFLIIQNNNLIIIQISTVLHVSNKKSVTQNINLVNNIENNCELKYNFIVFITYRSSPCVDGEVSGRA